MKQEDIIGVIYPFSEEQFNKIKKSKLFIKFPVHEVTKRSKISIREGLKVLFYISHKGTKSKYPIAGEAVIKRIEYDSLDYIKEKHLQKLPITLKELDNYAKGRENKKITVFQLIKFKEYSPQLFIEKPITMNGLLITPVRKKELKLR